MNYGVTPLAKIHHPISPHASAKMTGRSSPLASMCRGIARFKRLRLLAIRAICRFEGGQMWSPTYRDLIRLYYGVQIGMYSYGPTLDPNGLPSGTFIGNYCSLAAGVLVFRRNHPTRRISQHPLFFNAASGLVRDDTIHAVGDHPLNIQHDVWIGANAIITPRCKTIGVGAVIGAGAVVTKDVPPFTVVGGNPACQIGERFPHEIQEILLESRWWEYPIYRLIPAMSLFLKEATLDNAQRLQMHLRSSPTIANS